MYIYRLEHPDDRRGPYNSKHHCKIPHEITRKLGELPGPYRELGRYPKQYREFCAFKSLEVMRYYLSKEDLKHLYHIGFRLLKIKIEKYIIGTEQVLFQRRNIISCKDITEY